MAASPGRPTGRMPTRRRRTKRAQIDAEAGIEELPGAARRSAFVKYLGNEEKIGSRGGSIPQNKES